MTYWKVRCPMTGITDPDLLRASHIKPWRDCKTDAERLDVHNGLLLSALWDAAFDKGHVSFEEEGTPIFSTKLSAEARTHLKGENSKIQGLTDEHKLQLAWHRKNLFDH